MLKARGDGGALASAAVADYVSLVKPRAMSLVVVTALTAMVVAGGALPPAGLTLATLVGGCLVSAGANALNCYWDRDIDALMERTRRRPLPRGRLRPRQALAFGLALTVAGTLALALFANWLAAALALAANLFYVLVYTGWLKRRTPQNVVIGGTAGAIAPLIGWAAAANGLEPAALALAALVLCWTPPHFWALALLAVADYRRAGVPMLPVRRGEQVTKRQILFYAALTSIASLLPVLAGRSGSLYLAAAVPLDLALLGLAALLLRDGGGRWTRRLFKYSVAYLGILCLAMALDVVLF